MSRHFQLCTIQSLMAEGFSRPTIYKYSELGVLPPAVSKDPSGYNYTDQHVKILREIKRTQDERRTLVDLAFWARDRYPEAYALPEAS